MLRLLRVSPGIGRFFDDSDADPGAAPVVVIAHGLWRERFGSDQAAVGKSLTIDGVDHEIIGVAPSGFAFPEKEVGLPDDRREIALYTPLAVHPRAGGRVIDYYDAIARLRTGVSIEQAQAEATSYARSVERPLAELVFGQGHPVEVRVRTMVDQMTMRVRPALGVLATGVTLVLLIGCANVANLFLLRGSDRGRELAVRAALGARPSRLRRQLLTESLLIALLGGAGGVLVGWALTAAVPALAPPDFPRLREIHVDATFLCIAALAAVFVGAVSGTIPAIRSSRIDLAASMKTGSGPASGKSGGRLRRGLLATEAALAVVLLIAASLLTRSFVQLLRVDAGYDAAKVLTADVRLPAEADSNARRSEVTASLLERLRALPAVRAVGAGDMAPFGSMLSAFSFTLPGSTGPDGKPVTANALRAIITPGYTEALGMRLKEGRLLRAEDMTSTSRPLLVNETFARTYFNDGRPVTGRIFRGLFPNWLGKDTVVEIVGIVEDMLPAALDAPPQSQLFVAAGRGVQIGHMILVMRTADDPRATAPVVKDIIQQVVPRATVERMAPLEAKIAASMGEPRFAMFVLIAFAALALVLASTGLYGALSYSIVQRRREIAVRAALGATGRHVVGMVLREGLWPVLGGLTAGVALASVASRMMQSVLFDVAPLDMVSFTAAPSLLLTIACVACVLPARRAVHIDPAEALRSE